jgi:hypothetical protein
MRRIFMGLLNSVLGVLLVVFFCAPDSVDAFQAPGPEKNLTDDKLPRAFQPSAAWIRSAQYQNGYALVAYSVGDLQTEKAAWSRSPGGWTLATPVWGNAHVWDEPGLRWPDPENFCELYRCEDGAKWKNYDRAAQAVWTGLDDVAVIVAVGHDDAKIPINSLVVLSSKNGGENFKQATIISLTTPEGESGGGIDPDSVHASLMYTPERTNAAAGKKAIPIYVIWRNSSLSGEGWWMATFTVGINGGVALLTRPKKISAIAKTVAGYASVLAFQDDNLAEVVEIAWAERLDAAGNPSSGPVCPSTTNIRVKWWKTFSRNYSASDVPTWGGGAAGRRGQILAPVRRTQLCGPGCACIRRQ